MPCGQWQQSIPSYGMAQHYDAMHGGPRNMGGTLENMVGWCPGTRTHKQQETMQLLTKKKATLLAGYLRAQTRAAPAAAPRRRRVVSGRPGRNE